MHVTVARVLEARHATAWYLARTVTSTHVAPIHAPFKGVHAAVSSSSPEAPHPLTESRRLCLLKPRAVGVLHSSCTPHPCPSRALGEHGHLSLLRPIAEKTSPHPIGVLLAAIPHAPHAPTIATSSPKAPVATPEATSCPRVPTLSALPWQPVREGVALLPRLLLLQQLLPRLLRIPPSSVLLSQSRE